MSAASGSTTNNIALVHGGFVDVDSSVASDPPASVDDGLPDFVRARPRLFGLVYRILGSVAEAEDVIQDVWTRWQSTDRGVVRDPQAFLASTAAHLAINVLESARMRRETYVGPWLPEPVDTSADPGLGAERSEALELAVLMLLERLSPPELLQNIAAVETLAAKAAD